MKVYALLSWYNEQPEHLRRCVRSLKGFADVLVAVDGAYATFPGASPQSPSPQHWALSDAARATVSKSYLVTSARVWASEVEKRAAMFEYARDAGATPEDWFLIIDGDMALGEFSDQARGLLAETDRDVAEVRAHNVQIDGVVSAVYRLRFMFRALPGLTVERTHWLYTVPCNGEGPRGACQECRGTGRRFLWLTPDGHPAGEPTLDMYAHITLQHFNSQRKPDRKRQALDYYKDRDGRTLESVGDWDMRRGRLS